MLFLCCNFCASLGLFVAIAVLVDSAMKSLLDIKKVIGNLPDRLELPFSQTVQLQMVQGKLPLKFMCVKKKRKLIMETYYILICL